MRRDATMLFHRFWLRCPRRSAARFATGLLLALALSPAARAVTAVSIDHHADPVTLTVGETATIRFDVAKAGGTVSYSWTRDMTGTGKYDNAYPISGSGSITDGGGGDTDPAPGKIAWEFFVEPRMPAGRYILHLQDITDNSHIEPPGWTVF